MRHALIALACATLAACAAETTAPVAETQAQTLAPADLPAFFDCLRENGRAVVSAHRGGPAPGYAENALETLAHTIAQAPALLEIDIAQTKDGALVLMHDETVDRTTNGEGAVRDRTLAQIQALQLEDETGAVLDAHPPSLRDALHWAEGEAILELDVKRGVSYEDVLEEVRAARAATRVIFITYSVDGAARVHRLAPDVMIYTTIESEADIEELQRRNVDLSRIIAWTGIEEPNSALNVALGQTGIEARFGTLGGARSWDNRFAQSGDDQYAEFAETGLQVIATDRPIEAVRDLDAGDDVEGYAALQCVG